MNINELKIEHHRFVLELIFTGLLEMYRFWITSLSNDDHDTSKVQSNSPK